MEDRATLYGQLDRYVTKTKKNAYCCVCCPPWSWDTDLIYKLLNLTHHREGFVRRMDGYRTPVRKNYRSSENFSTVHKCRY
eukprot:89005-Karenia_brevis.AAC.1